MNHCEICGNETWGGAMCLHCMAAQVEIEPAEWPEYVVFIREEARDNPDTAPYALTAKGWAVARRGRGRGAVAAAVAVG